MRTAFEKAFIHDARRGQISLSDDLIGLRPREYYGCLLQLGGAKELDFDIIDLDTLKKAGEIALRVGDDESLFYLGHIGYHVDPPFQGRHDALRACQLCLPIFWEMKMRSLVITTDEDNIPSIRTCERLGCILESTVDVPLWCREEFGISARKRRYILENSVTGQQKMR